MFALLALLPLITLAAPLDVLPTQAILPAGSQLTLNIETNNIENGGTRAPVYIALGDGGADKTRSFLYDTDFKVNSVQTLTVQTSHNLTNICEMTIGMAGPNGDDDNQWFVRRVTVFYQSQAFTFEVNDWLSYDSNEGKKFITINNCSLKPFATNPAVVTTLDTLEVQFHTPDVDSAGTHAPVFLELRDQSGFSSQHFFTDEFPKKSIISQFFQPRTNLSEICYITIGMAGPKGDNDNQWNLLRATIFKNERAWTAFVNDWLSYDSPEAKKFSTVKLC